MLDKLFKLFFTEKKQNKKTAIITVVRESSLFNENQIIKERKTEIKKQSFTCLSDYFKDIKGLNLLERESFNLQTSK